MTAKFLHLKRLSQKLKHPQGGNIFHLGNCTLYILEVSPCIEINFYNQVHQYGTRVEIRVIHGSLRNLMSL